MKVYMWYAKTRVTSYELRVKSLKARVESLKAQVEIQKCKFKSTSYEFKSTSYEFKFTSYEFKSKSYKFKSTSCELKSNCLAIREATFISLKKTLCSAFKLLLPGTASSSTSYQQWHIRQWLLISAPCLCLVPFLIFSPIKQLYSKVGNSRMYRYGNAVFTLNLY